MHEVSTRFPPPYRLRCDTALFPVPISADDAKRLSLDIAATLFGQSLLWIIAAHYQEAWYGPEERPYPKAATRNDLYRELSYAVMTSVLPKSIVFGKLWVDAPDDNPISLGQAYGFPKEPASVAISTDDPRRLQWEAGDAAGPLLEIEAQEVSGLPRAPLTYLARATVFFTGTPFNAQMGVERLSAAKILRVNRCHLPYFASLGVHARPTFGLWFKDAHLLLGEPRRLSQR